MKKLNSLKLNHLSKAEMEKREMNNLKGGICNNACGCFYAGPQCPSGDSYYGGSSTQDNLNANVYAYNHQ
jgi:natural product precursor